VLAILGLKNSLVCQISEFFGGLGVPGAVFLGSSGPGENAMKLLCKSCEDTI